MFILKKSREFSDGLCNLKDCRAKAKIAIRLRQTENGNLGDFKSVGDGVFEMDVQMDKNRFTDLDVAEYLQTEEDVKFFLQEALAENDPVLWQRCVGCAARSLGMAKIAESTGLNRESLYKALKENAHPRFDTIMRVLDAMGFQLVLKTKSKKKPACVLSDKRSRYSAKKSLT